MPERRLLAALLAASIVVAGCKTLAAPRPEDLPEISTVGVDPAGENVATSGPPPDFAQQPFTRQSPPSAADPTSPTASAQPAPEPSAPPIPEAPPPPPEPPAVASESATPPPAAIPPDEAATGQAPQPDGSRRHHVRQ